MMNRQHKAMALTTAVGVTLAAVLPLMGFAQTGSTYGDGGYSYNSYTNGTTNSSSYTSTPSYPNYSSPSSTTGSMASTDTMGLRNTIPLRARVSSIPRGTTLMVKLDQPISSFSSQMGEQVTGTLENDILVNDAMAIPAGSEVVGQVSNVNHSGYLGKHGEIDVRFFSLKTPSGSVIPIRGHVVTKDDSGILKGNSYAADVAKNIGYGAGITGAGALGGTALGSMIGAAGSGAVFGTAVGGVAGLGYVMARKGKDVVIPSGSRISVKINEDTAVNN